MTSLGTERPWSLSPGANEHEFIDPARLGRILWTRRRTILAITGVCLALAVLLLVRTTPRYTAEATLMIESSETPLIEFAGDGESSNNDVTGYLHTQMDLIRARGVSERVVRDLNLSEHPELDPRRPAPLLQRLLQGASELVGLSETPPPLSEAEVLDLTTAALMERTSVWVHGKSNLVSIAVDLTDRVAAAEAANALAKGYIESRLEARVDMSMTAASWMNERLQLLRSDLEAAQKRLQNYLDAEGLVNVNGVATVSTQELSRTGDRMVEASRNRAEAQSAYAQVQAIGSQNWEQLATLPAVLDNRLVQQFRGEVASARARVEDLSRRYGAKHPTLQSARSDLAAATESLKSQVQQVVAGIERNYQLALANEHALRSSFDDNKSEIQNISRKQFKVRELSRDVEASRALYDTFATRLRETNATSDLASTNARMVDPARPPLDPSSPRSALYIAGALLLGLLAGTGSAIVLEVTNNTFKRPDELESSLDLPVMGIVPELDKPLAGEAGLLFRRNQEARFCEAIRTIRTNIGLAEMPKPRQVLLVTSTEPDEGKSSLVSNLGFAIGHLQRVLLVDADMRRPTLARQFGFPVGTPGLANLIAGTANLDECIREVDGIDVLPAGSVPPNPLELLANAAFIKLLHQLRNRYDRILIDTPPTLAVSDTVQIAPIADAVVYVVAAERTPIPAVRQGIGQLLGAGARIGGLVLNRFDVNKASKEGHFTGYYDHYGYSANGVQPSAEATGPAASPSRASPATVG